MADELIRLDTTIIGIDSLINKAPTAEEAKVLFTVKDVIYSQQRYVMDVQPVNQWISVKDSVPEAGVNVLVTDGINMMVTWCEYIDNQCLWVDNFYTKEVTHWMPLPEPPKDGDTE